jgi:hypothetical protein
MKQTFYQRAKEMLTKPITVKGTVALVSRIWKRKAMAEGIIKPPESAKPAEEGSRKSVDSGLWEKKSVGIRSTSILRNADELREKGLSLMAEGHPEYADSFNIEAADLYIQAGMLSKAEQIGLEFQERGRYMTAAKILSQSGAYPFFELLEYLHKNNLHKMARMILHDFTGPRGIVKYQEMYKQFPPELAHAFTGRELLTYAKKMMLQRKKHHVFQLAEIMDSASMHSEAAELYGLLSLHMSRARAEAKALVKEGDYLGAGKHCLSYNLCVEARDIATDAAVQGELLQAGELFLALGEKPTARALAARAAKDNVHGAVDLFNSAFDAAEVEAMSLNPEKAASTILDGQKSLVLALESFAKGDLEGASIKAHRADILESAYLLFEQGRHKESYQIAQGMKILGDNLGSEFCNSIAARVYSQGAISLMRERSNVIPFRRLRAA